MEKAEKGGRGKWRKGKMNEGEEGFRRERNV